MSVPVPDHAAHSAADASATRIVLGRGSLYTIATAGPALASVAVVPVVTRLLPVQQYDLVAVSTVVIQVAYILVALGLGAAITRQYILAAGGAAAARGVALVGAGIAATLTAVLAATGPLWSPPLLGRPFGLEIAEALLAAAGGAWMVLAQAYLRGADRPGPFVLLAVAASLLGPALGLAGLVVLRRTADVYLAGVVLGYFVAGLGGLAIVLRSGRPTANSSEVRQALRIGVPTVPHQVSLYLALAGLVVVADRLLGEGGRANVALTIGAGATVVTAGLNNAWAPVVYRAAPADRGRVLDETVHVIALVATVIAGGVALLAPWLVRVAAPSAYRPAELVPAVAFACAATLPSVLYLASGHLVFAGGRTGWLALSTPLAVAGGLVEAAIASPRWGLAGVGLGYLVAYVLLAIGTTAVQRHVAEHPWWPPSLTLVGALWVAATVAGAYLPTAGTSALIRVAMAVALAAGGLVATRRLGRSARRDAQPVR